VDDDREPIDETQPPPRRRRWLRWLGAVLALVAVAAGVLWWQRRGIAEGFVNRELARRGVPARYKIADIGLTTQRLTDVVIGDPRDPDLTADRIDVHTRIGFDGVAVRGIAVGHARLKARLRDGTLSLGVIDRLMPPPSGKPFALPAIDARLDDVRVRLLTDYGPVGMKLHGRGRLDSGFDGRLALVAPRLAVGGCTIAGLRAPLAVRVRRAGPGVTGPVQTAALDCAGGKASGIGADVSATLGPALDRWTGKLRIAVREGGTSDARVSGLRGAADFAGTPAATSGRIDLRGDRVATAWGSGAMALAGRYSVGQRGLGYAGTVGIARGQLDPALRRRIVAGGTVGEGTPIGPIARRLAGATAALLDGFAASATVDARMADGTLAVRVPGATVTGRDGGRIAIGGAPIRFGAVELGDTITSGGGGLPDARVTIVPGADGAIGGHAEIQPYQALNARIALTSVRFTVARDGAIQVATNATLSGPLGDGRVEALSMPIDARWHSDRLRLNPACAPLAWRQVRVAGLVLDPARLMLCPTGGALVTLTGGRLGGGATIASPRLTGRLGGTPLTLSAGASRVALDQGRFSLSGVLARLGTPDRLTRIGAAELSGTMRGGAIVGRFAGAEGQIGNVPLLLSDAAGDWALKDGALALHGTLQVADAAEAARFKPMAGDDVVLTLADSRIAATGVLRAKGAKVADVTLTHDLSTGVGAAGLAVPGIAFAEGGLQPDDLTPLTFGVVAAVNGGIAGRGDIAWNGDGVTSTGAFRTDGIDLAAAFGPVSGIKGEIAFSDLLGLETPPGQVATIATVNPGVPVENGTVRYRLMGGAKVAIEEGRWPFAGGALVLEPTVMDFATREPRRMTFRVIGIDAAQFLQQFEFKNLNATGSFDGVLPMVFDEKGGRIEGGYLKARGAGGIAYVGEVTQEDVGFWGNLAFQALKALDYRHLDITMNGPLAGEMITELKFDGISQGTGTKSNFLIRRLAKLPFVFNIQVRAPFRQLIDSVQSYYDPGRLIERNLPSLIEDYNARNPDAPIAPPPPATPDPIQPSESEIKP